jgi:hypothetical protein
MNTLERSVYYEEKFEYCAEKNIFWCTQMKQHLQVQGWLPCCFEKRSNSMTTGNHVLNKVMQTLWPHGVQSDMLLLVTGNTECIKKL